MVFWRRVVKGIEEGFETRRNDGDQGVEDEVSCCKRSREGGKLKISLTVSGSASLDLGGARAAPLVEA
jgi:hypothetical protein